MAGKSYEQQAKSKAEIAKEKSLITKQRIKEKEKASTKKEKKDLDAAHKRVTGGGIHAGKPKKGIDVEVKKKPKVSTPKKHPAHDPKKGGIHAGKPDKKKKKEKDHEGPIIKIIKKIIGKNGKAKAAEVGKGGKSPGPKDKRKSAKGKSVRIMKAEEKRRSKIKPEVTGRSSAASGAYKKKEAAERKKHVLGTLKKKPSGKK